MTQGERLARIETLLEAASVASELSRQRTANDIAEIKSDIKAIRKEFEEEKAKMAALENKGKGLIVGVGLASGGVGAGLMKAFMAWVS